MFEVLFYIFVYVLFVTSLVIAMHVMAVIAGVWCVKFIHKMLWDEKE